jgi:hypothetical protein
MVNAFHSAASFVISHLHSSASHSPGSVFNPDWVCISYSFISPPLIMALSPRYIIQIPVDLSEDKELAALEERGVHGRFLSVEHLFELENGNTEWTMALSSTPGGNIPTIFADMSMPSQIASVGTPFMDH